MTERIIHEITLALFFLSALAAYALARLAKPGPIFRALSAFQGLIGFAFAFWGIEDLLLCFAPGGSWSAALALCLAIGAAEFLVGFAFAFALLSRLVLLPSAEAAKKGERSLELVSLAAAIVGALGTLAIGARSLLALFA